jgi:hypothetical protein
MKMAETPCWNLGKIFGCQIEEYKDKQLFTCLLVTIYEFHTQVKKPLLGLNHLLT